MKIGYFSDIHTEFMRPDILVNHAYEIGIETFSKEMAEAYFGCDVIVAAGDISSKGNGVEFLRNAFKNQPVIFIPGNHDYYGGEYHSLNRKMRDDAAGSNVHFFSEGGTIEIDGVLFVAATLWTDFALLDNKEDSLFRAPHMMSDYVHVEVAQTRSYQVREALHEARGVMNDYKKIRLRRSRIMSASPDAIAMLKKEVPRKLTPADVMSFHQTALGRIKDAMAQAHQQGKRLVVVSHHAPSYRSLLRKQSDPFCPQKTDPFYASNLDYLMEGDDAPVIWIHGHTHLATLYRHSKTAVASNPKGYNRGGDTGWQIGQSINLV